MPYLQIMTLFQLTDKDVELQVKYELPLNKTRKIHIQLKFLIYLQLLQGLVHLIHTLLTMCNANFFQINDMQKVV